MFQERFRKEVEKYLQEELPKKYNVEIVEK